MKKKKILVLSIAAGSGHIKAGEAIQKTAEQTDCDCTVIHKDISDLFSLPIRKTMVESYAILVKNMPKLWGMLYKKSNADGMKSHLETLMKLAEKINSNALYDFIATEKPDYIAYTHFGPYYLIKNAPKRYNFTQIPCGMIYTDYTFHAFLVLSEINNLFVPTEKIAWQLEHLDIDPNKITISGIPINPVFFEKQPKKNETETKPNILLLAGGYGIGNVETIMETLTELSFPCTVTAIAGKNEKLEKKLKSFTPKKHIDTKVLGWVDTMHSFMREADLIISKPGGITVSECIALQKPLIAMNPIPGQEDKNAYHLIENNLGYLAENTLELLYCIQLIKNKKHRLNFKTQKNPSTIILEKILKSI